MKYKYKNLVYKALFLYPEYMPSSIGYISEQIFRGLLFWKRMLVVLMGAFCWLGLHFI